MSFDLMHVKVVFVTLATVDSCLRFLLKSLLVQLIFFILKEYTLQRQFPDP